MQCLFSSLLKQRVFVVIQGSSCLHFVSLKRKEKLKRSRVCITHALKLALLLPEVHFAVQLIHQQSNERFNLKETVIVLAKE